MVTLFFENGEIVDGGDYLIGRDLKVYRPDYYNDGVIEVINAQALRMRAVYCIHKAEYLEVMTEYKSRIPMTSRFKPSKKVRHGLIQYTHISRNASNNGSFWNVLDGHNKGARQKTTSGAFLIQSILIYRA